MQLWGGLECTLNRIGDDYHDQLDRGGHYHRLSDLNAISTLGIRHLRYPVLWERIAPDGPQGAQWRRCDDVLRRLRDLDIEPIIGFVHHGSGPPVTHLLDPRFPHRLTEYAAAFAARYPWVRAYTPINEPLTTARFSALYGYWYPHRRDDRSFVSALLIQCRAIVDVMRAIRRVNPAAQLVQTEDAGSTRGRPALVDQVRFETERRWLSLDLLSGRVGPTHPLWAYLRASGAAARDLDALAEDAHAPDIIGLNYYATSDRYLDDRCERYPNAATGGNGRQRYVDADAVRVAGVGLRGHAAVLEEAWSRYRRPLAIAEAHLGGTREEQMRWLMDAWTGAQDARARGVDVRAVTSWALLGSWDWDSLVTLRANHYEAGAFDVRTGTARATAVARVVSALAANRVPTHPVLASPGWWRRTEAPDPLSAAPVLITGADGTLGRAFVQACHIRGLSHVALSRHELDIVDNDAVKAAIHNWRPWAIVNAAGSFPCGTEAEGGSYRRVNVIGPAVLAAACATDHIRLLILSSDLVFGAKPSPHVESDPVQPQDAAGLMKAEAERCVRLLHPAALVVRTGQCFGPVDDKNFLAVALDRLAMGLPSGLTSDLAVSLTYVPDLVNRSLDLLIDEATGAWHLVNAGTMTLAEFVGRAARVSGRGEAAYEFDHAPEQFPTMAERSRRVLASERGPLLPDLDDALVRYLREREVCRRATA